MPSPLKPADYPQRVLLAVTGLSPQIVTETLFALAAKPISGERFVPTAVRLITTREGAERARLALLSARPGWFRRFLKDYRIDGIDFDERSIRIVHGSDGLPLDDIRSAADNEAVADAITTEVRALTAAADTSLHVSIAGGRKTMGYYAGYALSLFGRPQDRLSHVLVSPPYESHPGFYYPTPDSNIIYTPVPDNRPLDTRDAEVTLAEIPFVRLRGELPRALLEGRAGFAETVAAAAAALAPPELVLDPATRLVRMAGKTFALPPTEFALIAVLARRCQTGAAPLAAPTKERSEQEWARSYLADLRAALGKMNVPDIVEKKLTKEESFAAYFDLTLSRLNRKLSTELDVAASAYRIEHGERRPRRYRLALPADAIRFEPLTGSPEERCA